MMEFKRSAAILAFALAANGAQAAVLTEDFEAPFPAWESGWFGGNSNAQNVFGVGAGRGNNPDGLWINDGFLDGGAVVISFKAPFAASLTFIAFDVAAYSTLDLRIWDKDGVVLLSRRSIDLTAGAFTDPGVYAHFSVSSSNGIGGFIFDAFNAEGNTSIDNIVVHVRDAVPEPANWAMMIGGFALAGAAMRRRRAAVRFAISAQ